MIEKGEKNYTRSKRESKIEKEKRGKAQQKKRVRTAEKDT
jgi:hypothetical protein